MAELRLSRDVDIVIAELHPSTKVSLARAAASRGFLPIRAAYNAGCGAVGNWLARQPADHLAAVSCLVFAMSAVALAVAHVVAGGTVGDADGDAWQLAALCGSAGVAIGCSVAFIPIVMSTTVTENKVKQQIAARAAIILFMQTVMASVLAYSNCTLTAPAFSPVSLDYTRMERPLRYAFWATSAVPMIAATGRMAHQSNREIGQAALMHTWTIVFGFLCTIQSGVGAWTACLVLSLLTYLHCMRMLARSLWFGRIHSDSSHSGLNVLCQLLLGLWVLVPVAWLLLTCGVWQRAAQKVVWPIVDMMIKLTFGVILVTSDYQLWEESLVQELKVLDKERQSAEDSNEAKRQFLKWIFHELRVPLQSILLAMEDVQETMGPAPPADAVAADGTTDVTVQDPSFFVREATDIAYSSAVLMGRLLDDFLSLSKIEAGKMELEFDWFGLRKMIGSVAKTFSKHMQRKELTMRIVVDPSVPTHMRGDVNRLRQVVANFLSNACKFSPTGSTITIAVERTRGPAILPVVIHGAAGSPARSVFELESSTIDRSLALVRPASMGTMTKGKFFKVSVQDQGIGIDASDLGKLFTPFNQIKAGAQQKGNGTGLGLAICKHIVELSGGVIGVTSVVGKGSQFFFEVPLDSLHGDMGAPPCSPGDGSDGEYQPAPGKPSPNVSPAASPTKSAHLHQRHRAQPGTAGFTFKGNSSSSSPGHPQCGNEDKQGITQGEAGGRGSATHTTNIITSGSFSIARNGGGVAVAGGAGISMISSQSAKDVLNGAHIPQLTAGHPYAIPEPEAGHSFPTGEASTQLLGSQRYCVTLLQAVVVDDVKSNRELLARLLRRRNVSRVDVLEGGMECIAHATAMTQAQLHSVQVWLLDKEMPEMDGFETARRLRQLGVTAKIIGVTGNALEEDQLAFIAAGVDAVLTKPCTAARLTAIFFQHGLAFAWKNGGTGTNDGGSFSGQGSEEFLHSAIASRTSSPPLHSSHKGMAEMQALTLGPVAEATAATGGSTPW